MHKRLEGELEPRQKINIVNAFTAAVKAFAARASGPDVKSALESALRDQWIIAMAEEEGVARTCDVVEQDRSERVRVSPPVR